MQPGVPSDAAPAASATGAIVAPLQALFEHPLQPAHKLVIERVREVMLRHTFELHDFGSGGEQIHRIAVAPYIPNIEVRYADDPRLLIVLFTVRSKEAKQVLVWTSSLFFQYLHYHIGRIVSLNGNAHQMDWEAAQDPQAPQRIKRWVEGGHSIIERLHRHS
jgi:hypothetical protein